MKFLSIIYIVLLAFIYISCDNSQDKVKEDKIKQENLESNNNSKSYTNNNQNKEVSDFEFNNDANNEETNNGLEQVNQLMIETQYGRRISPETFKKIIPNSFMEYKGNVPSSGTLNYSGYSVTSLNNTYKGDRGFYKLVIQDFGDEIDFPEKKQFEELPEIIGMVVEKVQIENGKAYLIWDNGNNTGFLNALVYDRFIVKIDATNVLYKKESLVKLYNKINLKSIREITLKDKIKR